MFFKDHLQVGDDGSSCDVLQLADNGELAVFVNYKQVVVLSPVEEVR